MITQYGNTLNICINCKSKAFWTTETDKKVASILQVRCAKRDISYLNKENAKECLHLHRRRQRTHKGTSIDVCHLYAHHRSWQALPVRCTRPIFVRSNNKKSRRIYLEPWWKRREERTRYDIENLPPTVFQAHQLHDLKTSLGVFVPHQQWQNLEPAAKAPENNHIWFPLLFFFFFYNEEIPTGHS